jgi:L-amino acid N-acyltransferase YncA
MFPDIDPIAPSMSHPIRSATVADAAAICDIYNHYVLNTCISFELEPVTVEEMAQRIENISAQFAWLVYEEQGRILGYAYAAKWKPREAYRHAVESSIYLTAGSTGKGIGSQLYQRLFALLRERNVHTVIGGIAMPNAGSVAVHEKMGFVKVAHFNQVGKKFDQWIDVGYWQLLL